MSQTYYWAKKPYRDVPTPTVAAHCRDVCHTVESLFRAIKKDLADSVAIDTADIENLMPLLRAAALLHDLAKVNSAFQQMLIAKPGDTRRQPVRHEILAGWLLTDPDFFGRWFLKLREEEELWPVIWAVAGHHLKMVNPARGAALFNTGSGIGTVTIPLSVDEVKTLITEAALALNDVGQPAELADVQFDTSDDDDDALEQRINRFAEESCRAWNRLRRRPGVEHRTGLLKALLIAADVAASALAADGTPSSEWVAKALSVRMNSDVLAPVIARGTKGKDPLPFQQQVRSSGKLATIVIAGCGNGKTTAAYLWAQRHAAERKLWFTYPTTGTASAGYQGYLFDHPDLISVLMHGRAAVDLEAMQGTAEDNRADESLRLESLRAWDRQAVVCTVDTVLGLLQNQRRPLFSFPVIAGGAFVFDEIHSYDARLFGSLLRFLRTFPGAHVLLMSASIPPTRMDALREVLGDRAGPEIRGDPELEGYERYRLQARDSAQACHEEVAGALADRKKVLWVCNTVSDAIRTARDAEQWSGLAPEQIVVYHSRFRYKDRVDRQTQVVTEFAYCSDEATKRQRVKAGAALVIATQVCEMSLDISADLLVTAECPLPALVQRLGRLNRYATTDDPWPCLVYPFQGDPYNEKAERTQTHGDHCVGMAATRATMNDLSGKPCRQRELAERLDGMVGNEKFEKYSAWLDDAWLSEPAQLRDGDESITVIREEDLDEIECHLGKEWAKPSKWKFQSLVPWTIPMRYHRGFLPIRRAGGYPVAAAGTIAYCKKLGATWQKKTS